MLPQWESGTHMPNGRPIGRACENIFAHGRNWAGGSTDTSFRAGLGSPKKCKMCIRAGWAAHFLLGFSYECNLQWSSFGLEFGDIF